MVRQLEAGYPTAVLKRNVALRGKRTSVSLEDEFWEALREIAVSEKMTVNALIEKIDCDRKTCNLSSALRVFVCKRLRQMMDAVESRQRDVVVFNDLATRGSDQAQIISS
jgi:predicted DNA-binding ribbon-helix-helix protein